MHYNILSENKTVSSIIAEESPLFEKASIDEFYINLAGLDRYVGVFTPSTSEYCSNIGAISIEP